MNVEPPLWVIVTGPPAAGKTTLARRIALDLGLPLFEKDAYKDALFADLGFGDKDWSRLIGISAINLLFFTADRMLQSGASLITESNFYTQLSSERACAIANNAKAKVIQVHCSASPEVLLKRNAIRLDGNQQRPGHHVMPDEELLEGIRNGTWEALDVLSEIIRVDTSRPLFDYPNVIESIRRFSLTST